MKAVKPKPGKYVVAVSGGVDSMSLLDILARQPEVELVVAHFDHGIRSDSAADREFVQKAAENYGLAFFYKEGKLGPSAGEAEARQARYDFLQRVQEQTGAQAIITAHHQDDVLETAIINLIRGTGRKGLTALRERPGIVRPLLNVSKRELADYARSHDLRWREDPTNRETNYLRNYIRHKLLPRFSEADRTNLLNLVTKMRVTNQELDEMLQELIGRQAADNRLDRQWFSQLPHNIALEVMAAWLRGHGAGGFDSKTLERLVVVAKTARPGKTFPVYGAKKLTVNADYLALSSSER